MLGDIVVVDSKEVVVDILKTRKVPNLDGNSANLDLALSILTSIYNEQGRKSTVNSIKHLLISSMCTIISILKLLLWIKGDTTIFTLVQNRLFVL